MNEVILKTEAGKQYKMNLTQNLKQYETKSKQMFKTLFYYFHAKKKLWHIFVTQKKLD